ncbi:uncharacterized protein TA10455 [Theileria annulata]|uniref:Uncharacterized protein n=1 Tax=Theileria annulata TaxID=5874 RepID=Q4U8Z3_THEAN|nr:uncharacterized protein TA10455 [Theileria annulata]CAI76710.1 hypothetical protein, conserved [Theileria annulata]|eukprot:XP_953335.1 hypothetical protein, conserved [Theileria annulata]
MFPFKSDSHRQMFCNMLKLQIKSNILKRFGGMGQEECRIMKSKSFKEFLNVWANSIINKLPKELESHAKYVNSQINYVSEEVLGLSSVKDMIDRNKPIKWLIDRINSNSDNVPKPYFPSVLRNSMIQFPFKHTDIQKSRDLYGLLKFPFYKLSTSIYADSTESFKGLVEPKTSSSPPEEEEELSESHAKSSFETKNKDDEVQFSSSNYIYSPSELETGLRQ